jgi:hypothetical protein
MIKTESFDKISLISSYYKVILYQSEKLKNYSMFRQPKILQNIQQLKTNDIPKKLKTLRLALVAGMTGFIMQTGFNKPVSAALPELAPTPTELVQIPSQTQCYATSKVLILDDSPIYKYSNEELKQISPSLLNYIKFSVDVKSDEELTAFYAEIIVLQEKYGVIIQGSKSYGVDANYGLNDFNKTKIPLEEY